MYLINIYNTLLKKYGKQGWWPLTDIDGCNPTKTGCIKGYHPNDYSYPKNKQQIFEICMGAILTQNTSWANVEKAILNLKEKQLLNPNNILNTKKEIISECIRPAGYYNQKADYLKNFSNFFINIKNNVPTREQLLTIKGIGKETADSILLYAYNIPSFIIDTYTKRILKNINLINQEDNNYDKIKEKIENELKKDTIIYQEFHALLVEHAKRYYSKKPYGKECFLRNI